MKFDLGIPKKEYLKDRKSLLKSIALLLVLGVCVQLFAAYALEMILKMLPEVKASYEELLVTLTDYETNAVVLLYTAVLAPLLEELIFRIGIMWIGMKFMPFIMVNIMQALLFGIYHGNWVQGIYAFIIGLFLGYIRYESGWIFASIILHMSINIAGLLVEYTPLSSEGIPEKTLIMLVTVATAIGAIIVWYLQKLWNGETDIKLELPKLR